MNGRHKLNITKLACPITPASQFSPIAGAPPLAPNATFMVGEVTDTSSYVFSDSEESFDLAQAMRDSLQAELAASDLTGANNTYAATGNSPEESASYFVDVNILDYAPGNAGLRWLLPGTGVTKLWVECAIVDANKLRIATVKVEHEIYAGGGFTIGAYKYIFTDVAKEIVRLLRGKINNP